MQADRFFCRRFAYVRAARLLRDVREKTEDGAFLSCCLFLRWQRIELPARFAPCPPAASSFVFLRSSVFCRLPLYLRKTHRQLDLASEVVCDEIDIAPESSHLKIARSIRSHRHGACTAVR